MDFMKIGLSEYEKKLVRENLIDNKKQMSRLLSDVRQRAKRSACYCCGESVKSFCDSHYVPRFCLKNIAMNGKLKYFNDFIGFDLLSYEKGVKQAGVFNLICRLCDSKLFQEYENPDNYISIPTTQMLAEIAMKDYLKFIYKRDLEKAMNQIVVEKTPMFAGFVSAQEKTKNLDLLEYENSFRKARLVAQGETDDAYELFFYMKLPYVVPIAVQSLITLISDLNCECVNNIYDFSPNYHPRDLHLAILPLKNSSAVLLFCDANESRYQKFIKQFSDLELHEQLGIINYMVFLYTEDYFLSPSVPEDILKNTEITNSVSQSANGIGFAPCQKLAVKMTLRKALKAFDLNEWKKLPNLLDEKYKIRSF